MIMCLINLPFWEKDFFSFQKCNIVNNFCQTTAGWKETTIKLQLKKEVMVASLKGLLLLGITSSLGVENGIRINSMEINQQIVLWFWERHGISFLCALLYCQNVSCKQHVMMIVQVSGICIHLGKIFFHNYLIYPPIKSKKKLLPPF